MQDAPSSTSGNFPEANQNADVTMDSPMAGDDVQSAPMVEVSSESITMWQDMPAEQKIRLVDDATQDTMQVGETWYLVSARWYKNWNKAVRMTEDKEGPVEEKDLGPVDNSDLVDEHGRLVENLVEGENVKFVPERLWEMFQAWCVLPLFLLQLKLTS
jgi:ubiquitin carboxyl-terminal hydrolase 4/11/15